MSNLSNNPLLSTSTYRSHHRLDNSTLNQSRRNWISILQNNTADEVQSLDRIEESEEESEEESVDNSKNYYKKLLSFKNKTIIKQESNNDALRMLFKGVIDHQERCQVIETSVKNIQQSEIDLHESYIEDLEKKVVDINKKLSQEKKIKDTTLDKLNNISKQLSYVKKQIHCVICHSRDRDVIFYPCMHVCCCNACSNNLYTKVCPTCRTEIQDTKVIYLS